MTNLADYVIDKEESRDKGNPTEIKHTVVKGKPPKGKIIKVPRMEMVHETQGNITSEFDSISGCIDDNGDINIKDMETQARKKFKNEW